MAWVLALVVSAAMARAQAPKAIALEPTCEFQKVVQGVAVEHVFLLRNEGSAPLRIQGVNLTPPLMLARMPAQIGAGQQIALQVRLDTSKLVGLFEGEIEVLLDDPGQPSVTLTFSGSVAPIVELSPMAEFYVSGSRGTGGRGTIEIINHDSEPLRVTNIEHTSERFTLRLDTVEDGRRYRLTLDMKPEGPGGKAAETVLVSTSNPKRPVLTITANTYLRERVYTFPDAVDLGVVSLAQIKARPQRLAQTLMIYQQGGTDFKATFSSDLPLTVDAERGPNGDRWQATITLRPERLQVGRIAGSIVIETNDPRFPRVTVPVSGEVLP